MKLFRTVGRKFEETKRTFVDGMAADYVCRSCGEPVTEDAKCCPECGEDAVEPVE